MKRDRWKAVRRGQRFCAPACGRGCTIHEYNAAKRNADAMVKALGQGWRAVLSENLGWFARAEHPASGCSVSWHDQRHFWATTQCAGPLGQVHSHASTARAAVNNVRKMLRASIVQAESLLSHLGE